jgi:hypothetical protein
MANAIGLRAIRRRKFVRAVRTHRAGEPSATIAAALRRSAD